MVRDREYILSGHAEDEMYADDLERADVEYALLNGTVNRKFTDDARGPRYRVAGPSCDGRPICVICRIKEVDGLIIITVYAKD
jgi:hypothetical protein